MRLFGELRRARPLPSGKHRHRLWLLGGVGSLPGGKDRYLLLLLLLLLLWEWRHRGSLVFRPTALLAIHVLGE